MGKQPTKSSITLIASIVVACFSAILVVLGLIGRNSFAPKIIDQIFGLSNFVLTEITKKVDSGYSGTFILAPTSKDRDAKLLFYAEKGQTVKTTIKANQLGSMHGKLKLFVDNNSWCERELPYQLVHGDITDKLKFDEPGANLHVLRLVPGQMEENALVILECLVLVYNK